MKSQSEKRLSEQAADWIVRLEENPTAEDQASFRRWLLESPRHVEEAVAIEALYRSYEDFDLEKRVPVLALVNGRDAESTFRAQWHSPSRWWGGVAAAVLVAAFLGWHMYTSGATDSQRYTTDVGEQRSVELPDGSVVHMNTQSELRVRYSSDHREVQLVAGEALFRVMPEAARPFQVIAAHSIIQAVGTQFNVYRRGNEPTTVMVLEGRVNLLPITVAQRPAVERKPAAPAARSITNAAIEPQVSLGAGQGAWISKDGVVDKMTKVDADEVMAWRQRRLVFHKDTLADVVAQFNRYNRNFRFEIGESQVADRRVSGVFDADDPSSLMQFLKEDASLRFEKEGETMVIRESR